MKRQTWNKWPLLGVAATAVVLAAPPDASSPGDMRATGAATTGKPQHAMPSRYEQPSPQINRADLERLKRAKQETAEAGEDDVANAFPTVSWYEPPPPPPPPPPAPEPAPVAPPVPFTYFGRYEDPSALIVMLSRNEQVYTVSEGDVIDETYRVERIADGSVSLVYLPLGINQTINTGAQ